MGGNPPMEPRRRSRTRSPLPVKYDGPLKEVESSGPPLERHQGAQRDNRPAWMTKGVGVGTEIFGKKSDEPGSELVKPGITRADLDKIHERGLGDGPDPFGDVFKERPAAGAGLAAPDFSRRAPLPDQSTLFSGSGPPAPAGMGAEAAKQSGRFKVELCTFWPLGKCTRGDNCTYAHGESDLRK